MLLMANINLLFRVTKDSAWSKKQSMMFKKSKWKISKTWVMKAHFGLDLQHKKWKLYLIPDQLGLGCSQKNANQEIAQPKIRNLWNLSHHHSKQTWKVVNFYNTEKELLQDIQLKIEHALVKVIRTVLKNLLSLQ